MLNTSSPLKSQTIASMKATRAGIPVQQNNTATTPRAILPLSNSCKPMPPPTSARTIKIQNDFITNYVLTSKLKIIKKAELPKEFSLILICFFTFNYSIPFNASSLSPPKIISAA